MSYITLKCKNCGSNMSLNTESNSATCVHCGSTFLLSEILDEKDMAFAKKFTPKNLEKKMMAQGAIKKGETFLYQAEYDKAETSFKRAIDLDDSNYKAYLGVVKAKTKNLNVIPENDDYLQYAHYALSLATDDDLVLVKSELAKIELLRHEKVRQKKIQASKKKHEAQKQKAARKASKLTLFLSLFILTMLSLFFFISTGLFNMFFEGVSEKQTINIDSYESLSKVFASTKYLNYEINITKDIDCENRLITPLGSKDNAFTGSFNGNKHKISNAIINVESSNTSDLGLFGYTVLANINNIILDNVDISVTNFDSAKQLTSCGILAGTVDSTIVNNIEIKETCNLTIENTVITNDFFAGGLIGKAIKSSHISKISSHTALASDIIEKQRPSDVYIGGIVGLIQNSGLQNTCSNSMMFASIKNNSYTKSNGKIGGIVGYIDLEVSSNISNIRHNFFSGSMNTSMTNVNYVLSAIANSSATPNSSLYNYCLFRSVNFKLNNSTYNKSNLGDYSTDNYFTTFNELNSTYLSNLLTYFANWKNLESFTPSLV